jgi:hypothetical protein
MPGNTKSSTERAFRSRELKMSALVRVPMPAFYRLAGIGIARWQRRHAKGQDMQK